jgi:hypothetical protein
LNVNVGQAKEPINAKQLSNWNLLARFRNRLAEVQARFQPADTSPDPNRLLLEKDYFSLILFGLFNPVVDSMRGLCAASKLGRVQREVCGRKVSLGSFSEAQSVFDPELLKEVFLELSGEVSSSWGDPRLNHLADKLHLVDGTLFPALPRMHWALWGDEVHRAGNVEIADKDLLFEPCGHRITVGLGMKGGQAAVCLRVPGDTSLDQRRDLARGRQRACR